MKPNFLGIGTVRGGSTWLHETLASHPDFNLPERRKEIQFFTKHWSKGTDWYYKQFASSKIAQKAKWNGEITPGYLICKEGPQRIHSINSIERFVLILRNPVERFISHYKWHLRVTGEDISIENFKIRRVSIENGMYHKHVSRYLKLFSQEQFLFLIHEEAVENSEKTHQELAHFFEVNQSGFAIQPKLNSAIIPRFRGGFKFAHKTMGWCRKHDLDWAPNLAIRLGMKKLLSGSEKAANKLEISEACRLELYKIFEADILKLEDLIQKDLSHWKSQT